MTLGERTYLPFLDVTRILAVLGVVAIHVVGGAVGDGEASPAVVALDMGLVVAVPVFLMMAGALNLDPRAHRHGPAAFLHRRAVRIVPAMVVWSAFYIVVIKGMVSGVPVESVGEVVDMVITGRTYTHLYFLFAIAGLYLIAPVLAAFLAPDERRRSWVLGLLAAAWTVAVSMTGQLGSLGVTTTVPVASGTMTFFLLYTGYFVLGRAVLVAPVPRWAGVLGLLSLPGFVALVTWLYVAGPNYAGADGTSPTWVSLLAPTYASLPVHLFALVLMASVASLCPAWRVGPRTERVLRVLGTATFGIFLVHFAVMVVLRAAVPALDTYYPAAMAVTWTVTVLVSTVIALIGQRVPVLRLVF